jgi:hypothetical protein
MKITKPRNQAVRQVPLTVQKDGNLIVLHVNEVL